MSWSTDRDPRAKDQAKLRRIDKVFRPRLRKQASGILRAERDELIALLKREQSVSGLGAKLSGIQEKRRPAWERYYRQLYVGVGRETMEDGVPPGAEEKSTGHTWSSTPQTWSIEVIPYHLRKADWVDQWLRRTLRYADRTSGEKIKSISAFTKRRIQIQIHVGVSKGESVTDLIKRIDKLYLDSIIPNRAEVIARTELLTAARAGDHHATIASGFADDIVKSWLTSGQMDRTRDTHLTAEATERDVPFKEPFKVGGADLAFPGDSSMGAPAEETVQCMCSDTKRLPR